MSSRSLRRILVVVLDRDLFSIPATDIHRAKVLWTFFEGRAVYRAPASGDGRPSP